MQAPGFWDDQERAAAVSAEHSTLSRRLESFRSLESDLDDLEALEEMAAAEATEPAGSRRGQGNGEVAETVVKSDRDKIGRNDPCWCGSGKKFKKCHGA